MTHDLIPFVDLYAQHAEIRAELDGAIAAIIDRSTFIGGEPVAAFEREFAAYLGVKEAVALASGTDGLWLGLYTAGVKAGDAVITVPNTFIATTEAITRLGAQPLFVDIDLETALLDLNALQVFLDRDCRRDGGGRTVHKASGRPVRAIVPVHLYGLPVDTAALMSVVEPHGIRIVEDACQAHGARYRAGGAWVHAGKLGASGAFSFYPGKNLGALGDAGAIVTDDPETAALMRRLREHGAEEKYRHLTADGWTARLDSLQAAVLSIKLKKLDEWNARRKRIAAHYREALAGLPLALPAEPDYAEHVFHLYVVRSERRDWLRQELSKLGIQTGLHYPLPLHLQPAYAQMGLGPGSFPNAERSAATGLSLPMHPTLTLEQVERVGAACAKILL